MMTASEMSREFATADRPVDPTQVYRALEVLRAKPTFRSMSGISYYTLAVRDAVREYITNKPVRRRTSSAASA
jgi:tRNA A37 N6-isopentenylltransferase MiaA